ncbi:MutS-related protein [Foetidibacter luteolus]|uniref:MutS-related protein n=1 Tax=Foetidibacter luteolus TaxID=2608880 RepID=UPI00129A748F|nr:DNA mismatch repair protein MutS [Foetidibacter luteolus]
MQADKTTISDLSIFTHDEEQSVAHHIDFARTNGGRDMLHQLISRPLDNLKDITETQQTIQKIIGIHTQWPQVISNGTVMVIQRYYETALDDIPSHPNYISSLYYKLISGPDYSIIRYSVNHFLDFVKGMYQLHTLLSAGDTPTLLQNMLDRISRLLQLPDIQNMLALDKAKGLTPSQILETGAFLRTRYKEQANELVSIYSRLDAYYSMATACMQFGYQFPVFSKEEQPFVTVEGLFHPLLRSPVPYTIGLTPHKNFLFLTGANMGGKSTFIKAVGVAVYLAHIGMAVPAAAMQLTLFDGLLSNIQVADNIVKGESYFFNEVQRIRKTIEKISDGKKWLILIDELFKGTNVQDAMKCSTAVVEGLRKMKNALFVLSTHLYEIGEGLKQYPNIQFRYFETEVKDDQLLFSYQLKEGISNDRLGYLILRKEGVVKMLEEL